MSKTAKQKHTNKETMSRQRGARKHVLLELKKEIHRSVKEFMEISHYLLIPVATNFFMLPYRKVNKIITEMKKQKREQRDIAKNTARYSKETKN